MWSRAFHALCKRNCEKWVWVQRCRDRWLRTVISSSTFEQQFPNSPFEQRSRAALWTSGPCRLQDDPHNCLKAMRLRSCLGQAFRATWQLWGLPKQPFRVHRRLRSKPEQHLSHQPCPHSGWTWSEVGSKKTNNQRKNKKIASSQQVVGQQNDRISKIHRFKKWLVKNQLK